MNLYSVNVCTKIIQILPNFAHLEVNLKFTQSEKMEVAQNRALTL